MIFINDVFNKDDTDVADMCKLVIIPHINSKMFANELKSKGIQSVRKSAGIFYTGIDINESDIIENNKKEEKNITGFDSKCSDSWKCVYGSGDCLALNPDIRPSQKFATLDYKIVTPYPSKW